MGKFPPRAVHVSWVQKPSWKKIFMKIHWVFFEFIDRAMKDAGEKKKKMWVRFWHCIQMVDKLKDLFGRRQCAFLSWYDDYWYFFLSFSRRRLLQKRVWSCVELKSSLTERRPIWMFLSELMSKWKKFLLTLPGSSGPSSVKTGFFISRGRLFIVWWCKFIIFLSFFCLVSPFFFSSNNFNNFWNGQKKNIYAFI